MKIGLVLKYFLLCGSAGEAWILEVWISSALQLFSEHLVSKGADLVSWVKDK